uniref:Uncharacterized protein n=1 Tax=Ixodes ricinus TaxID=34613 RepID=A0A6B0UIM2_IXORI
MNPTKLVFTKLCFESWLLMSSPACKVPEEWGIWKVTRCCTLNGLFLLSFMNSLFLRNMCSRVCILLSFLFSACICLGKRKEGLFVLSWGLRQSTMGTKATLESLV